jgi:hypothetical protein
MKKESKFSREKYMLSSIALLITDSWLVSPVATPFPTVSFADIVLTYSFGRF